MERATDTIRHEGRELPLVAEMVVERGAIQSVFADSVYVVTITQDLEAGTILYEVKTGE